MSEAMKPALGKLAKRERPTREEIDNAFAAIMDGEATPAQTGAWLLGLRALGETSEDIEGAVRAMRARMVKVSGGEDAIDVCGTGGDGANTLNISTAVAFIVAGAGQKVAKHGNSAMSSLSGGADTLKALGLDLKLDIGKLEHALKEANIAFLFAQNHHPATRFVAPVRRELGFRTLFNCIGPLTNPAGVKRQIVGVFDAAWLAPMANALGRLGARHAWVIHGEGGLDELSPMGESRVAEWKDGAVRTFAVSPADAGLQTHPISAIKGGDPAFNAAKLRALFDGEHGAYRDTVLLNAAAAFVVADKARTLAEGAKLAAQSLDSGAAKRALEKLLSICGAARTAAP